MQTTLRQIAAATSFAVLALCSPYAMAHEDGTCHSHAADLVCEDDGSAKPTFRARGFGFIQPDTGTYDKRATKLSRNRLKVRNRRSPVRVAPFRLRSQRRY